MAPPEPRLIELKEWQKEGRRVSLPDEAATILRESGLVRVTRDGGAWRLRPTGKVGAVRIGDLEVHVEPKVTIARLLFMLSYARKPGLLPEDVSAKAAQGIWPILGESLARHCERALLGGVLQGYQNVDDTLLLLRGRVRVADQLARRPGMLLPLEVRYDEFTADIPENRILLAAVRRMLAVPGLDRIDHAMTARLTRLVSRLAGVSALRADEPIPAWTLSRINQRYASALRFAELILMNQSVEPGPKGFSVASFVVPMEKVFEDFVTVALAEALQRRPGETRAQHGEFLDHPAVGHRQISMEIDVVHTVRDRAVLAVDAKYKITGDTGGPNADYYQMLAYCTALRLKVGWLVYAKSDAGARIRKIRNSDITIIEYPLDLEADPEQLLASVEELVKQAWPVGKA